MLDVEDSDRDNLNNCCKRLGVPDYDSAGAGRQFYDFALGDFRFVSVDVRPRFGQSFRF